MRTSCAVPAAGGQPLQNRPASRPGCRRPHLSAASISALSLARALRPAHPPRHYTAGEMLMTPPPRRVLSPPRFEKHVQRVQEHDAGYLLAGRTRVTDALRV